jgi:antitoxin HigA-1
MSRPAIHPGEILAEELAASGVTPTELARLLKVPANRITQIIQGKRSISGDTALRLGHWFGTSGQFWLNLQSAYDIRVARARIGRRDRTPPYAFRIRRKTSTVITREKSTRTPATGAPLRPIGAEVAISRSAAQKPAPNAWQPQGARHETGQQNSQGVGLK